MRRLEGISIPPSPRPPPKQDTEFKPYQLKPKRDTKVEPFLEPPILELPPGTKHSTTAEWGASTRGNPKRLKQMKKKLDELNRKIRHSRKKHNGMIHK